MVRDPQATPVIDVLSATSTTLEHDDAKRALEEYLFIQWLLETGKAQPNKRGDIPVRLTIDGHSYIGTISSAPGDGHHLDVIIIQVASGVHHLFMRAVRKSSADRSAHFKLRKQYLRCEQFPTTDQVMAKFGEIDAPQKA